MVGLIDPKKLTSAAVAGSVPARRVAEPASPSRIGPESRKPGPTMATSADAPARMARAVEPRAPARPQVGGLLSKRPAGDVPPIAHDREGNPIQGVSGRLGGLLSSNSPYLQSARNRALRMANRRGLMNSSIAAGAGEAAAIEAALPIATTDANIAAQERAMRSQEFQQYRSIRSQELMQKRGLDHDAAQRESDRELKDLMQKRDHRVQQLMQQRGLDHDAAQKQADRELQSTLQARSHAHETGMQSRELSAADRRQQADLQARADEAQKARDAASAEAEKDRTHQEKVAATNAHTSIDETHARMVTAITLNPDVPKEARDETIKTLNTIRDDGKSAIGAIRAGKDPVWTTGTKPAAA